MTILPESAPSRRVFLGASAVAAVAGLALPAREAEAAATPLDFAGPADRLKAYMAMRGAPDGRLVIGFLEGHYYGVVDGEVRPLFGLVSATFSRYRPRPDGGFDCLSYEAAYFLDPTTGRVMERFRNPYTDEEVSVPDTVSKPSLLIISPNLDLRLPELPPGLTITSRVHLPQVAGNDVWISQETMVAIQLPGAPKPLHYNEFLTLHASRSDLEEAPAKPVPCRTAYTSVVDWRPWLKMGDRPGHLMAIASGRYGAPLSVLPAAWRDAVQQRRPDILADPDAPLAAVWKDQK